MVAVRPQGRTAEQELARVAGSAHGVVTRARLLRAGVTGSEIKPPLRTGALLCEHRGVNRVGHRAPSIEAARYLAAVLACGDGALLSGRAAGHLLAILKGPAPRPEVTTPTERRISGVKTMRSRCVDPEDATTWRGIPVTSAPRTLVDLAAVPSVDDLARTCHEAGVRHGTTPAEVEAVLARRPNSAGARKVRAVIRGEARVTLSKARSALPGALVRCRARPPSDEPSGERATRRLPLAGAPPDGRARQLHVPPLPPRLGAGPPPRA
jgi:hypothetical protein